MKVIVCGAGQVGHHIAKHLAGENNDVTVIDRSAELVRKLGDSLDVKAIIGHGSHPDVLEQAGVGEADMLIAVTFYDEVNMVACQVAHSLFNVPTKIARIRTQSYLEPIWRDLFSRHHMPIDVIISPEYEVARAALRRLEVPGTFDVIPLADDLVRVAGVHITEQCPIIDTPLTQLTELFPDLNIVVCGIIRGDRMIVPGGTDSILVGDNVYFVADKEHLERSLSVFGHEEPEARRVVIVGGGNVGLFLARDLEAFHPNVNVRLIEADKARAEIVADQLERAIVINGDALDSEILREASVNEAETIVALANDDEVNILSSLLAKREGCPRAITLVNNSAYKSLIDTLGIDVFIDPRETTVSTILQHVRRGRIRGLHSLADGRAEVIDAEALETSSLVGVPLRELRLSDGMIIGAIVRQGEVIIPRGDTVVKVHDRVIIFALAEMIKKVEQLFSVRLSFF
jgi:trk system potassium uptake protein TrkA